MRVEHIMGTAVRFDVPAGHEDSVERAVEWLRWVDRTFTTYDPDSEIMRLRAGLLDKDGVHPEVAVVLDRCLELRALTGGAFDHRPHGDLDPSAYVKGWAVERAAAMLAESGAVHFSIDAGGDMAVRGRWRIGIKHPAHPDKAALILDLTDRAIATSGRYERGDHIWGTNPGGLASVTVVGPDLGIADAVSTALFACGGIDTGWLANFRGYEVAAITNELDLLVSPGIRALAVAA